MWIRLLTSLHDGSNVIELRRSACLPVGRETFLPNSLFGGQVSFTMSKCINGRLTPFPAYRQAGATVGGIPV
ncbi:MAG: hypothetical protein ACUZ8I_14810 [Candidatus Scalindua sp.]